MKPLIDELCLCQASAADVCRHRLYDGYTEAEAEALGAAWDEYRHSVNVTVSGHTVDPDTAPATEFRCGHQRTPDNTVRKRRARPYEDKFDTYCRECLNAGEWRRRHKEAA